jgi:hypothetical protein
MKPLMFAQYMGQPGFADAGHAKQRDAFILPPPELFDAESHANTLYARRHRGSPLRARLYA